MSLKVFIHIGPPKSGTSAIQKYLLDNQKWLMKNGIFYPDHTTDLNGVSSGNYLQIFDRDPEGAISLSNQKIDDLYALARKKNAEILLLSSEFFFMRIDAIAEAFPEAIFIAYIRSPLDLIESNYNQSVKRHSQVECFSVNMKARAFYLDNLSKCIENYGRQKFILRPYQESCFVGESLVSDFISNFMLPELKTDTRRINSSYSFEGLEFKRWFNQFDDQGGGLHYHLDLFLQKNSNKSEDFSLIEPEKYLELKSKYCELLEVFCTKYKVKNSKKFLQCIQEEKQKKYKKQELSSVAFENLLYGFLNANKKNKYRLKALLDGLDASLVNEQKFLMIAKSKVLSANNPPHFFSTLAALVSRFKPF